LRVTVDCGRNELGDILQRWDDEGWKDHKQDEKVVGQPFDIEMLPPR